MKPIQVLGAAVKRISCHGGVILNGLAVSNLHHADHSCDMQVTPIGVYVVMHKKGQRPAATLLVPFANIYFMELLVEEPK